VGDIFSLLESLPDVGRKPPERLIPTFKDLAFEHQVFNHCVKRFFRIIAKVEQEPSECERDLPDRDWVAHFPFHPQNL
jgi:hypothetical protein